MGRRVAQACYAGKDTRLAQCRAKGTGRDTPFSFTQALLNNPQRDHLEFVASAIFPLLTTPTADSNPRWLAEKFSSQDNIDGLLASSSLFKMAGTSTQVPALTPELQQLSAKASTTSSNMTEPI